VTVKVTSTSIPTDLPLSEEMLPGVRQSRKKRKTSSNAHASRELALHLREAGAAPVVSDQRNKVNILMWTGLVVAGDFSGLGFRGGVTFDSAGAVKCYRIAALGAVVALAAFSYPYLDNLAP
jgi:hypothetical protein